MVSLACVAALGTTTACIDYLSTTEDFDAVLTVRQPGRTFTELSTFAILDRVVDLGVFFEDSIEIDHSFDALILETVVANMNTLGWRVVASTPQGESNGEDDPDVAIVVGAVATNNWTMSGYYPWYGYDPYYALYPPVVVPVNYPVGSIIITMVKTGEEEEDEEGKKVFPVVWAGAIRGLLESSRSDTAIRIENLISQAFDQSPYLNLLGAPQ